MSKNVEFELKADRKFEEQYQELERKVSETFPEIPEIDAFGWDYHNLKLLAIDTVTCGDCIVKQYGKEEKLKDKFHDKVRETIKGIKDEDSGISRFSVSEKVLGCNFDSSNPEDVKKIVNKLKEMDRDEYKVQKRVYRPWGFFQNLELGDRFQVKRIMVKVGSVLSLQKHHHRSEHWIIVKGTGQVTLGQETFLLTEGQSTYIPLGEVHRIGNPGNIDLEFIEVQIGSYLGEDDIVRLEDQYGRIK